jgi:hypothetical protein
MKQSEVTRSIVQWFREHHIKAECPTCLSIKHFKMGRIYRLTSHDVPSSYVDVIPVICPHCGHVRLFDADLVLQGT